MKKKRILLVDDEVGFTRLLKLNLEQIANYEVRVENWAEKALSAAREFQPDLVLLDIIMPCMIGTDIAARLKEDAHLRFTPIIYLSAVGGLKSPQAHSHFVDGSPCITKPASVEDLIEGIERNLPKFPVQRHSSLGENSTPRVLPQTATA